MPKIYRQPFVLPFLLRDAFRLLNIVGSVKRFAVIVVLLVALAAGSLLIYDLFIQTPINLPDFTDNLIRITLIVGFWLTVLIVIGRSKQGLAKLLGDRAATVVQILMGGISLLIMTFAVLRVIGVSPDTLLTGAGIASITIGLVVSTFVGSLLSGVFVLGSHRFRVGDNVIFNNIPGRITEITAILTRVKTEVGVVSIPNSAIASGTVLITKMYAHETASYSRLPYIEGDRVVTTYMEGEGTVKEITPLYTKVILDSARELTFLNSSVLAGSIAVARVFQTSKPAKDN